MAPKDSKPDNFDDIPHTRKEPRPDFSKPLPVKPLPTSIQATLDSDEKLWEALYEGHTRDSTDTSVRYAAYANRLRTVMSSAHRYVAYTSEVGESFRPVAHPWLVRSAFAVSWAYVLGDVGNEMYKARLRNQRILQPEAFTEPSTRAVSDATGNVRETEALGSKLTARSTAGGKGAGAGDDGMAPGRVPAIEDWRAVGAQRFVFQSLASMLLPAATIHQIVKFSGKAMKDVKNVKVRTWGPVGLGLATIPALPYIFDHPIEQAVEWAFHNGFKAVGGPEAVGDRPVTGKKELRQAENNPRAAKEKEL